MRFLSIYVVTCVISACVTQQSPGVQPVGTSQQQPKVVGTCIAKTWADQTQQQVISQNVLANDLAMDVYVSGQQPPAGAAVMVRPNYQGSGTWVGLRGTGSAGNNAPGDISCCL
ncbi:hypothetical protein AWB80_07065 [Caballeronia pedi]|uniref:Lipoprotein n=1 Tax=Caballeronia pedi TaxID=1777141 RepID=A0A158DLR2_9BURK|nr:hypothetical protein [Caballeronia pedi]SAK95136.1 hypothetical protein AWB80_07065 [Caballeronia pedi]